MILWFKKKIHYFNYKIRYFGCDLTDGVLVEQNVLNLFPSETSPLVPTIVNANNGSLPFYPHPLGRIEQSYLFEWLWSIKGFAKSLHDIRSRFQLGLTYLLHLDLETVPNWPSDRLDVYSSTKTFLKFIWGNIYTRGLLKVNSDRYSFTMPILIKINFSKFQHNNRKYFNCINYLW